MPRSTSLPPLSGPRPLNFKQIEAFRAVMATGSASRAAEALQVTQPTISRVLADLEENIGFALFNRVHGRLVPTAEAQLLLREVAQSFIGLDRLRGSAARIRDFGSGGLRLTSLSALGVELVPQAIKLFTEAQPEIGVTLQIESSSTVRDLVASGRFDLGLAADEIDASGIEHQLFTTPKAVCVMPAEHRLAERKVVRLEDLHGERFIALAPEDTVRRRLDALLDAAGIRPLFVVETPSSSTVCALAMEGVGIGIASPYTVEHYAARGLVSRPFSSPLHFKSLLVFRPDIRKSRIVQTMVTALVTARNAMLHPRFDSARRSLGIKDVSL